MFKFYSGDYQWDRAKEIRKKKGQEKNEICHRKKLLYHVILSNNQWC